MDSAGFSGAGVAQLPHFDLRERGGAFATLHRRSVSAADYDVARLATLTQSRGGQ
jgi:hypothetical protein